MRLNFILTTIMCSVLLLSLALYIIIHAIKGNLVDDWSGMGFAKGYQKKFENGNIEK